MIAFLKTSGEKGQKDVSGEVIGFIDPAVFLAQQCYIRAIFSVILVAFF
jgi:hypothetical protein